MNNKTLINNNTNTRKTNFVLNFIDMKSFNIKWAVTFGLLPSWRH